MALDFPSSPVDGQISGNYIYSSSSGAWKGRPQYQQTSTQSPTAPTSPNAGDIWIDTTDGTSYHYLDDGTSRQWVEFMSSGVPATPVSIAYGGTGAITALSARTNLQIPVSQNYLVNSAFDIWQKGDTVAQNAKCGADQWYYYYYYAMSQIRVTSGLPPGSTNAMRVRSDANGNLIVGVMQVLETKNAIKLAGKKVTFSVKVRRSSAMIRDITLLVYKHATYDQSPSSGSWTNISSAAFANSLIPTGTTSADWYTASITVDIPNDNTANTLWFEVRASGGMDNGVYYEIAEAQVEEGPVATVFHRQNAGYQAELAACQRYYIDELVYLVTVHDVSYSKSIAFVQFPVTMRTTPSVTPTGGQMDGHHVITPALNSANQRSANFVWTSASGGDRDGASGYVSYRANAEL